MSPEETYHRIFHRDLESFFPNSTINLTNSGISGETATQALTRFERDVLNYYPDLLLIAFGLNDSTLGRDEISGFSSAIREMIQTIKSRGSTTIVLLTPPFMATARTYRIHPQHEEAAEIIIRTQTEGILGDYAQALRDLAKAENVLLADVYAEWSRLQKMGTDLNSWLANGLNHPDVRGHQLAAKAVWNTLFAAPHS